VATAKSPDPVLARQEDLERWSGEGISAGHGKLDLGLGWDNFVGLQARARVGYGLTDRLIAGAEAFADNDGSGWHAGALTTLTLKF
jgi:hypothetical protein